MMNKDAFIHDNADITQNMLSLRRALHQDPELSEKEFHTQKRLIEALSQAGIETQICADTGLIAIIRGAKPGKTFAVRGDIDALPITEKSRSPYASKNPGVMHACGHDAHTSIAYGVALYFQSIREELEGNLKVFFQPAEETVGGAKRMVEEGCLENPHVDGCLGLHVMPYLPVGQIETRYGALNASTESFEVNIYGKGGHGAIPDQSVDALLIGAQIVTALQSVVSRVLSPLEPAVLTIGSFQAGSASNIIAGQATLKATLRTSNPEQRIKARDRILQIVTMIATGMGGRAEVEWDSYAYDPLVNDSRMVDLILETGTQLLGPDNVKVKEHMSMGGEDFSFFIENCPGAFYHIGCQTPGAEEFGLHSCSFELNEDCLAVGLFMQVALLQRLFAGDYDETK